MTATQTISKPTFIPSFEEYLGQAQTEFIGRSYDDVDGIVADAKSFDWKDAPRYRFPLSDPSQKHPYPYWDCESEEDLERMRSEAAWGVVQATFPAVYELWYKNSEYLGTCYQRDISMIGPCNLGAVLNKPCYLLWGLGDTHGRTMIATLCWEFLSCGRQLIVSGHFEGDCLHVTLTNGDPLEEPWWGKQLEVDVDKAEASIVGQQQQNQIDDPDYIPF